MPATPSMSKEIKIFTKSIIRNGRGLLVGRAAEPPDQEAPVAVRRLNHAVLYVNGLARSVEFYTTTLGFEIRAEIPGRAAFLRAPGTANDHDLGLFDIGTGQAGGRPSVGLY